MSGFVFGSNITCLQSGSETRSSLYGLKNDYIPYISFYSLLLMSVDSSDRFHGIYFDSYIEM